MDDKVLFYGVKDLFYLLSFFYLIFNYGTIRVYTKYMRDNQQLHTLSLTRQRSLQHL